jgi:uncharacterized coiled-coil protein SlyX
MGNILRAVQAQVAEDTRKLTQESLTLQQLNGMIVSQTNAMTKTKDLVYDVQKLERQRANSVISDPQNQESPDGKKLIADAKKKLEMFDQQVIDSSLMNSKLMDKMTSLLEKMIDQ